jgi:hypothetical protein
MLNAAIFLLAVVKLPLLKISRTACLKKLIMHPHYWKKPALHILNLPTVVKLSHAPKKSKRETTQLLLCACKQQNSCIYKRQDIDKIALY